MITRWLALAETTARTVGYVGMSTAGALVLTYPPATYEGRPAWMTLAWGVCLFIPGLVAAVGCAVRRYRWELVPLWPLALGLGVYALLSWESVIDAGASHSTRAALLTGAMLWIIGRALHLQREDRRARLAVIARREVTSE